MTEFDCPKVNLCGWQGIKIQLLTNYFRSSLTSVDIGESVAQSKSAHSQKPEHDQAGSPHGWVTIMC